MDENDTGAEGRRAPAQQAHQPQPSALANAHAHSPFQRIAPENTQVLMSKNAGAGRPAQSENAGGEPKDETEPRVDGARFAAGVVKLYEAVLKEPIPEDMLRLIDQLGKQERKIDG